VEEVEAMSRAVSPSGEQPYGLARVLRTWKIPRSGFYARRKRIHGPDPGPRGRRGPDGPCDDATLLEHIRRDLQESPWHGEGHRKVWARLRLKGLRSSKVRVRRLMRENGGLAPVRHDHGSAYLSDVFQDELRFLGAASSPAFVREPEGNGCAERFIRTLKENLLWVRSFTTMEELRQALLAFKALYNRTWLIERHGFQTPAQARQSLLENAA
jgi:hypothetical protein